MPYFLDFDWDLLLHLNLPYFLHFDWDVYWDWDLMLGMTWEALELDMSLGVLKKRLELGKRSHRQADP